MQEAPLGFLSYEGAGWALVRGLRRCQSLVSSFRGVPRGVSPGTVPAVAPSRFPIGFVAMRTRKTTTGSNLDTLAVVITRDQLEWVVDILIVEDQNVWKARNGNCQIVPGSGKSA